MPVNNFANGTAFSKNKKYQLANKNIKAVSSNKPFHNNKGKGVSLSESAFGVKFTQSIGTLQQNPLPSTDIKPNQNINAGSSWLLTLPKMPLDSEDKVNKLYEI